MPKSQIHSAISRFAIWTVHGERCYQCNQPVHLFDYQIDHVIPQSLEGKEVRRLVKKYGRPDDFNVQGFENLLPSCARCNREKSDRPWDESLMVQRVLQIAEKKKKEVLRTIESITRNNRIEKVLISLVIAHEAGELTPEHLGLINELTKYQARLRLPENRNEPFRATKEIIIPMSTVASTNDVYVSRIEGPIIFSLGPDGVLVKTPSICKKCGGTGFDHTTCADCGNVH